jgi:hypothetical protein
MPVIHSRADWGAQPPKRSAKLDRSKIGIVDVHWPGSKGHLARDRAGVAAALRGWQTFHMKTRGWSDIAYNIGVDLAGEVWELRGWDAVDGGVASRGDDVTILLVMGDQDQMTDAMKSSTLWVMAEWERRLGRKLRRTHHSALAQTDCPGPEATAWSRAGFPAPNTTTTPTIQEDDMPSADDVVDALLSRTITRQGLAADDPRASQPISIGAIFAWLDAMIGQAISSPDRLLDTQIIREGLGAGDPRAGQPITVRTLLAWSDAMHGQTQTAVAAARGEIAGLTAALQSITTGQGLDLDAVKKAVAAAVAESLAGLDADVTLTIKGA